MLSTCVADRPAPSVIFSVKFEVPWPVGVPETVTELVVLEPKESPAGKLPALTLQE
jgi:hypothetical protein